jgi:hypothetical protein
MISFTITAGQQIQPASATGVVARFGVVPTGDAPSTIYQFAIGQDVGAALPGGPVAVDAAYASTYSGAQHIAVKVPATTAGTFSSVTKPGGSTSPTPTVAGSSFDSVTNSPFDAYTVALRYAGGLPGACSVDIALDAISGIGSFDYTYPMPPSLPATLQGTVNMTGFTWASLNGLTLRWKLGIGSILTVTFGTVAGESDVLAAFTAQSISAAFVQIGDNRFLQVYGAGHGSTDAIYFCGGSAEDLLGFVPAVAVQRSSFDLATGFTFSSLDNETLIFNPDTTGNVTPTFGSSVAAEADILAAFSGHATLAAYIVHTAAGHHYLEVAALTPGVNGTHTLVCGAGTANANLGYTNTTSSTGLASGAATGTDSRLTVPGTGFVVTFPYGLYAAEIHTFSTTAPRHSKADYDTALAALNARVDLAFGLVELVQEPVDATDLAAYVNGAGATAASWEAQPNKRFVQFLVPAPRSLSDSAVAGALVSQASRYTFVAARWLYMDATKGMPQGSFPRSTCRALSTRLASMKQYSNDPGDGTLNEIPGCHMIGPDGVTMAPDENTATVKLGGSRGPGYTVVEGQASGGRSLPFFVRGVSRAGSDSLFVDIGVTRMVARCAQLIFAFLQKAKNLTFDLNPDGTIQEEDAKPLETAWTNGVTRAVVATKNASSFSSAIDRTTDLSQTRALVVNYTVQERGQGEDIEATLTLVGTLTVT